MKNLKKKSISTFKMVLFVLLGNALLAFVVTAFIIPHNIIMGGTTGIAIVLNKTFGIDTKRSEGPEASIPSLPINT